MGSACCKCGANSTKDKHTASLADVKVEVHENSLYSSDKTKNQRKYDDEIRRRDEIIAGQKVQIQELEDKNNELLTRLSALASAKLTDGNANIADLSDVNRPTKLAEQFSELYDNQWTDAFECLTKTCNDKEACMTLLKVLCDTYKLCNEKAQNEYDSLVKAMTVFSGDKEIPREFLKHFKDSRKKKKIGPMNTVLKELDDTIKDIGPVNANQLKAFEQKCLELCWLMVIQDPPVYIDTIIERANETFNSNTHKNYTKSGKLVDFIVWPTLYLCKDGSILAKGVAQCKEGIGHENQLDQKEPKDEVQKVGFKVLQTDDRTKKIPPAQISATAMTEVKEKHVNEENASKTLTLSNIQLHENESSGDTNENISIETFDTKL